LRANINFLDVDLLGADGVFFAAQASTACATFITFSTALFSSGGSCSRVMPQAACGLPKVLMRIWATPFCPQTMEWPERR